MVVLLAFASVPLFGVMVILQGEVRVAPAYYLPAVGSGGLDTVANLTSVVGEDLASVGDRPLDSLRRRSPRARPAPPRRAAFDPGALRYRARWWPGPSGSTCLKGKREMTRMGRLSGGRPPPSPERG